MLVAKLIKNSEDHAAAVQRISDLMDADPAPGSPATDELELLAHLAEAYEMKRHFIGLPNPLEAIYFRMEQQGLRLGDLVSQLGSPSRVSEVLRGKRQLTLAMIRRLHQDLAIPLEVLLQPMPPGKSFRPPQRRSRRTR